MPIFARKEKTPLGIYIHVPFCRSRCQYCDFYSCATENRELMSQYTAAITRHIKEAGPQAPGYRVDTVYFGGGTPSFFGAEGMAAILTAVRRSFDVAQDAEITFEANPDSVNDKLLRRLRAEGFNRVSLGIQTDDDELLALLGRPHDYAQAEYAVKRIRKAGFRNLSLDLMYGLPGQTPADWERTLRNVMELNPEHMSCYGLKLEEGTPLYEKQGQYSFPDDDTQADMYLSAVELLGSKGYRQYEISNFAKRNCASRHNMKYWMGGEYLGFGPNASSDFAGKRFAVIPDLKEYIAGVGCGGQVLTDVQEIPRRERAGEYLMTQLRTTTGISREEYEKRYLLPFAPLEEALQRCAQRNLAVHTEGGRWNLTPEGFLISNSILSDLLLIQERSQPLAKRRT